MGVGKFWWDRREKVVICEILEMSVVLLGLVAVLGGWLQKIRWILGLEKIGRCLENGQEKKKQTEK